MSGYDWDDLFFPEHYHSDEEVREGYDPDPEPAAIPDRYVCVECGESYPLRAELREHFREEGHGPRQTQADALDRARWSVMGEAVPPPRRVDDG
jgi:hypothetical protein